MAAPARLVADLLPVANENPWFNLTARKFFRGGPRLATDLLPVAKDNPVI